MTAGRPRNEKRPGRITVNFDLGASEQIRKWMTLHGFDSNAEIEAVRAMVLQAMASTPRDGLISAARAQAYREIRIQTIRRVMVSLTEIKADLGMQLEHGGES